MNTVQEIYECLCQWAPIESMEPWDNCGFQIGRREAAVNTILVALDITPAVIDEAVRLGAELIVSHHPLVWRKMGFITDESVQGQRVLALLRQNIAAICMHTPLDMAPGGVDDTLCAALGLQPEGKLAEGKFGRISTLPAPMTLREFLPLVKQKLGANGLQFVDGGRPVRKIATGCGACGDYVIDAAKAGCDTFITSDLKYSDFLDGQALGLNLIDAGHFPTENAIVPVICQRLRDAFPDLTVRQSESMAQPDQYFI
jgi:dinuclear metal center YbgI/SA1388 family protein